MPSLDMYNAIHSNRFEGEAIKLDADAIENETWWNDIASRKAYLYDFYHDDEPLGLIGLHSDNSGIKTEFDIKYIGDTSQTYSKDVVTFHIQLRPGQECNVDYYEDAFVKRYGAQFPVGLYIDIPDERGIYNRWMVVNKADFNNTQFPTFEVLPCDYIIQYVIGGIKYQIPAVLRSQNSYIVVRFI